MKKNNKNIDWRSICPISSSLDVLGDKWSLLIVRDLIIHKYRTYSEFLESPEQIATNILASRLDLLSHLKLIERVNPKSISRNNAYRLTKGGEALKPIIKSLGKWAGEYLYEFNPNMLKINETHRR